MFARVIKKTLRNWLKALAANHKLNAAVLVSRSTAFAAGWPMCHAARGLGAQQAEQEAWDPLLPGDGDEKKNMYTHIPTEYVVQQKM